MNEPANEVYRDRGLFYKFKKRWSLPEVEEVMRGTESKQVGLLYKVLEGIKSDTPSMLELGASEGYYSYVFDYYYKGKNRESLNICLEPLPHKCDAIINNLPAAKVYCGYIGEWDTTDGDYVDFSSGYGIERIKKYSLKEIINDNDINVYDILHVDIQGGERGLIEELMEDNLYRKFNNFFISTHDHIIPGTHNFILEKLRGKNDIEITVNTPVDEGYGFGDGFIFCTLNT
tara:strand:+ start:752 stop:1444 length:693 start_codon:yes stop_codon:yes gene_type:complete